MSRAATCDDEAVQGLGGSAPACTNRITWSRTATSVGIERISKASASSGCASVSTLPNTTPGCCSAADSKIGPNRWQGPHHDAQKSTRTISLLETTSAKFSAVSSTVDMLCAPIDVGRCRRWRPP